MTKNELIEAINATIVPNGQKAITAESLANLLMEIVNATPEGGNSGSGALRVWMNSDMTDEQKVENADAYTKLVNGYSDLVYLSQTYKIEDDGIDMTNTIKIVPNSTMVGKQNGVDVVGFMYADGGVSVTIILNSDGSVIIG